MSYKHNPDYGQAVVGGIVAIVLSAVVTARDIATRFALSSEGPVLVIGQLGAPVVLVAVPIMLWKLLRDKK
jgi:hypothetical protein